MRAGPAIALTIVLLASSTAAAQRVIGPGHEVEVRAMLDAPLDGCTLGGVAIVRDRIEASYACDDGEHTLVVHDAEVAPTEAVLVGDDLAIVLGRGWPRAEAERLLAHADAHAPSGLFSARSSADDGEAPRSSGVVSEALALQLAILAVALAYLALGAIALARGRPDATVPREAGGSIAHAAAGAAVLVATITLGAATFRFAFDDFTNLLLAGSDPLRADPELRLVGIRAPFALGHALGDAHGAFVALNALACATFAGALAILFARAGAPRAHAIAAGTIAAGSSYVVPLLRWGVGIQHLAALAILALALVATDVAARAIDPARRRGAILIAGGLALLAVLTKWPIAILIPISTLVWCREATPRSPLARLRVHVVLALLVAIPIVVRFALLAPSDEPGIAAPGSFASSLEALATRTTPTLLVLAALAITEIARRALRIRASPPALRAAPFFVLAAVSIAPFLANTAYFADYYPALAHAWIAAWAVLAIAARTGGSPWLARASALLLALLALPWIPLRAMSPPPARDGAEEFLAGAASALDGHPIDAELAIRPSCPDALPSLDEMLEASGGADGLRWALGAPDLALEIGVPQDTSTPALAWCPSDDPAWRLEVPR